MSLTQIFYGVYSSEMTLIPILRLYSHFTLYILSLFMHYINKRDFISKGIEYISEIHPIQDLNECHCKLNL